MVEEKSDALNSLGCFEYLVSLLVACYLKHRTLLDAKVANSTWDAHLDPDQ